MSGSHPNRNDAIRLIPKRPPGRSSRKARAFAAEIGRLHALGYTFEAIREALADAGVQVSKSTVQREATRLAAPGMKVAASGAVTPDGQPAEHRQTPAVTTVPAATARTSPQTGGRSGRDIAEAFVRDRITNPLIRTKEHK